MDDSYEMVLPAFTHSIYLSRKIAAFLGDKKSISSNLGPMALFGSNPVSFVKAGLTQIIVPSRSVITIPFAEERKGAWRITERPRLPYYHASFRAFLAGKRMAGFREPVHDAA